MTLKTMKLISILLSLYSLSVFAEIPPEESSGDPRIKIATYQPNEVFSVKANMGYSVTIELEKGEYVTDRPALGKEGAWSILSLPYSNEVKIKPIHSRAGTNLNFQTNKGREYSLILHVSDKEEPDTFRVRFDYPPKTLADFHKSEVKSKAKKRRKYTNYSYSFWGDSFVAPIRAMDDGRFTVFRFRANSPIPAILTVNTKTRRESIVNYRIEGDDVVIEGAYPQYTFRYGDHVTCVFNEQARRG